jgi:hypothetical protein
MPSVRAAVPRLIDALWRDCVNCRRRCGANGTDGGRGGSLEQPAGEDVTAILGGGGGGGVGYIHIASPDVQLGSISPPPT